MAGEDAFLEPFLEAGFSVVRFDWRDTGLSTWRRFRDHPYSIDALMEDAWYVLDGFGSGAVDLVGFSMGGCVAQLMALQYPERVRSLSLIASGFASAIQLERGPRAQQFWGLLAAGAGDQVQTLVDQWRVLYGQAVPFDEGAWQGGGLSDGWTAVTILAVPIFDWAHKSSVWTGVKRWDPSPFRLSWCTATTIRCSRCPTGKPSRRRSPPGS